MTEPTKLHSKLSLYKAINLIEEFRKLSPIIQAQHVQLFLEIAAVEGQTVGELATKLGMSHSSISRSAALLSKTHRNGSPGHDLVEGYENPLNASSVCLRLTPKGRRVAASVSTII